LYPAYQTEIDNLTKRSKTSENAFLNVYKVLAEAPDPYPLLEAAVVRHLSLSCPYFTRFTIVQDQTVKISEARELEGELQRLREENVELRKKVSELANIEAARKSAETRVEVLEAKVRQAQIPTLGCRLFKTGCDWVDGSYDSGKSCSERK
jgi:homeobox protein cut-like